MAGVRKILFKIGISRYKKGVLILQAVFIVKSANINLKYKYAQVVTFKLK